MFRSALVVRLIVTLDTVDSQGDSTMKAELMSSEDVWSGSAPLKSTIPVAGRNEKHATRFIQVLAGEIHLALEKLS